MTTRTATSRLPAAPQRLHRMSLEQYHRLIESGLFRPSDRLVLLDGILVKKMTKGPRHCTACEASWLAINAVLPAGWHARKVDPITLPDGPEGVGSEPEPDVAVVAGPHGTYKSRHPGPGAIALVVEVADTLLEDDREALRRYAWAAIPAVWIVNLTNDTVEVYTGPSGPTNAPGYQDCAIKRPGDVLGFMLPGQDGGDPVGPIGPVDVAPLLP
jgi:hypothetical protein